MCYLGNKPLVRHSAKFLFCARDQNLWDDASWWGGGAIKCHLVFFKVSSDKSFLITCEAGFRQYSNPSAPKTGGYRILIIIWLGRLPQLYYGNFVLVYLITTGRTYMYACSGRHILPDDSRTIKWGTRLVSGGKYA